MIKSMMQMMYTDALMGLASGYVDDNSRDILSYAPLPPEYTDPFAAQDTDPTSVMKMTGTAMTAWIEEARKADYFSKHFIQLSKLIMNGTVTMARGLMSLHNRGGDPSQAPMSIGDLISLGSYHFRKSYLGVLQTVKSQPEVSERLLMNQIGWANTLLRLYKTKEKLETPVTVKPAPAELPGENQKVLESAPQELPQKKASKALKASEEHPYSDLAAVFEPGSYTAPRAYSSLDGTPAPRTAKRIAASMKTSGKAETSGSENDKPETKQRETVIRPEMKEIKSAETSENEAEAAEAKEETPEEKIVETASEASEVRKPEGPENEEKTESEKQIPAVDGSEKPGLPPADGIPGPLPGGPPDEDLAGDPDPPRWFQILSRACARKAFSGQIDTDTFTEEEILLLISDPEFCAFFPDIAESLRSVRGKSLLGV